MPRYFSPEDNPWGEYTRGSTWQDMQSRGDVVRLVSGWSNMLNPNYSQGRQLQILLQVKTIDDFLSLASVEFVSENELCLLTREQLEAVWVEFSNLLKNNFLTVVNVGGTAQVDSSLLSVRAFSGRFDVNLSGELEGEIDEQNRDRRIYITYPMQGASDNYHSQLIALGYPYAV